MLKAECVSSLLACLIAVVIDRVRNVGVMEGALVSGAVLL